MAHITGMYRSKSDTVYMETIYPVLRQILDSCKMDVIFKRMIFEVIIMFMEQPSAISHLIVLFIFCSMFSLLFLHFFLFGCNIFVWRKTRINYSFIFELCPTKELKYRDVFLICTTSMAAVVGVLFIHLSLVAKGYSYAQVQAIPGLLLLVYVK